MPYQEKKEWADPTNRWFGCAACATAGVIVLFVVVVVFLIVTHRDDAVPSGITARPQTTEKEKIAFFQQHEKRFEALRKMFADKAKSERDNFTHLDLKDQVASRDLLRELHLVGGVYMQEQHLLIVTSPPEENSGTDGYAYSARPIQEGGDQTTASNEFKSLKSGWYLYHRP